MRTYIEKQAADFQLKFVRKGLHGREIAWRESPKFDRGKGAR